MALTKNSELFVWGSSDVTGMDETENRTVPKLHNFFKHLKISQIASGGLHAVILTKVGEIYTWGSTEGGQLGLGPLSADVVKTPQRVEKIGKQHIVVQIACGEAHTIALTGGGKIWGWGMGMYG